jgi:hypothetical protein
MRWDQGTFGIERECACKSRSFECGARGFHVVESSNDRGAAITEASKLGRQYGFRYRVTVQATGEVIS